LGEKVVDFCSRWCDHHSVAGPYNIIYSDPPWHYNSRKAGVERKDPTRFGGGAEKHYALMSDAELLALKPQIDDWAASSCALFMWATCPRLDSAISIIKGWGFRFCTVAFVWEKINKGNGDTTKNPGYYTASNVELVLLGCRGSMRPEQPMIRQVVRGPRQQHSRKPEEVRSRIEQMYPAAKRIEMFARERAVGWDAWGLEVPDCDNCTS